MIASGLQQSATTLRRATVTMQHLVRNAAHLVAVVPRQLRPSLYVTTSHRQAMHSHHIMSSDHDILTLGFILLF